MKIKPILGFTALLSIAAGSASAQTYFATQGTTLFRGTVGGGAPQQFALADTVVSLGMDPSTGDVYAFSQDANLPPGSTLHRLNNPFSANPTLSAPLASYNRLYVTFSFVGNKMYAFQNFDNHLVEVDLTNLGQVTPVGATGFTGLPRVGGSGYDAVNDVMYAIEGIGGDGVFTVDYSLSNGPDPSATQFGNLGLVNESSAGDFFNGVLYAAVENTTSGNFEFGTVSTITGAFTPLHILSNSLMANTGLMVVPAPGAAVVLSVAGLAAARRRRR